MANPQTNSHLKIIDNYASYPSNSVLHSGYGKNSNTVSGEFRFNSQWFFEDSPWDVKTDYQLIALYSETLLGNTFQQSKLVNDDARLLDLTHLIDQTGKQAYLHRLDRLNLGYSAEKVVVRVGRQALSWGKGLMFNVMDIVNPFDGRVFDQEYKSGDDMLYLQYLQNNGNDFQFASVVRRNIASNEIESNEHTYAGKYHGFFNELEFDFLVSQHYGDEVFAVGLGSDVGGAVVHGEFALTQTEYGDYISALSGISYSWVWAEHNFSGAAEIFYNEMGFGDTYSTADLVLKPALLERSLRGEAQLLGKNYLGGTVTVEISPLIISSANIFFNSSDDSGLLQITTQYDWQQNSQIFFAVSLPFGAQGGELKGIESPANGMFLSVGPQVLAKASWYF